MNENLYFFVTLIVYALGTVFSLIIALAPLAFYVKFVFMSPHWVLVITAPLGIAFLWLIGCLIYILIHSQLVVPITLPSIKEGEYPMNSGTARRYFLRLGADNIAKYWIKSLEWVPFLAQVFLYPFMLRQYGVKMGKHVYISTETRIDAIPFIEIGDSTFIAPRAVIGAHINHHGNNILFKSVKIGKKCFIGHNSVVTPGAVIEDEAILGAFSAMLLNTRIPSKEVWAGLPAVSLENSKIRMKRENQRA